MSTDRETTRIVRSWLRADEDGPADRVLDAVLDRLDTTPQRRATWWPARRLPEMNNTAKLALAAAAVVALAFLGLRFLVPGGEGIGGPGPTPTPSPASTPIALPDGPLEAGTYVTHPLPAPNDSMSFTFSVPDGWEGAGGDLFLATGTEAPDGAAILFTQVTGLYSDPCNADYFGDPDVSVGPTVDDLASAFAAQSAYQATTPIDITVGGFAGKRVDLQLPSDVDLAACDNGGYFLWDGSIYAQGPGNRWHLWILDVDGVRVVILAEDFAGTAAQDQAELQGIVDSMRIEP